MIAAFIEKILASAFVGWVRRLAGNVWPKVRPYLWVALVAAVFLLSLYLAFKKPKPKPAPTPVPDITAPISNPISVHDSTSSAEDKFNQDAKNYVHPK